MLLNHGAEGFLHYPVGLRFQPLTAAEVLAHDDGQIILRADSWRE